MSLAACANGDYDVHWRQLAQNLTSAWGSLPNVYLRVGHEMDGGWYSWRAQQGQGDEVNFAGCFRAVVKAMRSEKPDATSKFVYNPSNTLWSQSYLNDTWPGDAFVDVVGLDFYDQNWGTGTYPYPSPCDQACQTAHQTNSWNANVGILNMTRDFAKAHGKPFAIPEWGTCFLGDGHGGNDNPFYMQKMAGFIKDPSNNVLFHVYFDVQAPDGGYQISTGKNLDYTTPFVQSGQIFKTSFQ